MNARRHLAASCGAILFGAVVTWFVVATSFDPLLVTGSTAPATIWGSSLDRHATAAIAALLLLGGALGRGQAGTLMLVFWIVFLASATHRLTEEPGGRVADIWLGMTVQTLPPDPSGEPPSPRCRVGPWLARCAVPGRSSFVSPTPLPFTQLVPGAWDVENRSLS